MSEIVRVPMEVSGVSDSVQLDAQCTLARLLKKKMGVQVLPCRLLASWENGVLSISYTADGQKYVLSVRLDETIELLAAAKPGCMVQHCLPAYREQEITTKVFEEHANEIFEEAENRLHAQKAVMVTLMGNKED